MEHYPLGCLCSPNGNPSQGPTLGLFRFQGVSGKADLGGRRDKLGSKVFALLAAKLGSNLSIPEGQLGSNLSTPEGPR